MSASAEPRISFGIIVLNGEPFTRYTLRALYPHAFEIIVVEGAAPAARAVATADGHSLDDTREVVADFMRSEDSEGKVRLVCAEDEGYPDGFWPGEKHEQSRAYARRAAGDYLWQVDIDEFYLPEDIERVRGLLRERPDVDAVSFTQRNFWGSPSVLVDGWYLRGGGNVFHRLFRWREGYEYQTHRPPTVVDERGVDLRRKRWLDADQTRAMDLYLYHYSLLFPKQVREKCTYYAAADWVERGAALEWYEDCYLALCRPFRVHNVDTHPSWLEPYEGPHPPEVSRLWTDAVSGSLGVDIRDDADVRTLLADPWYRLRRQVVRHAMRPVDIGATAAKVLSTKARGLARRLRAISGRTS